MDDEPVGDGSDVEGYEQLRGRALSGDAGGWRLGLALLERRGVAAWARARATTVAVSATPLPPAAPVSPVDGDGVVGVLAAMALACLRAG